MSNIKDVATALASLVEGESTTVDKRAKVRAYLDHLDKQDGVERSRFLRVGGADVLAYWYERPLGRFLILAHKAGAVQPWVVGYVRELTDSEWDDGRYKATYGDAVELFRKKIHY